MSGKKLGATLAALAALAAIYEEVAIWTSLPTISRLLQVGHRIGAGVVSALIFLFALWLCRHLIFEHRSEL